MAITTKKTAPSHSDLRGIAILSTNTHLVQAGSLPIRIQREEPSLIAQTITQIIRKIARLLPVLRDLLAFVILVFLTAQAVGEVTEGEINASEPEEIFATLKKQTATKEKGKRIKKKKDRKRENESAGNNIGGTNNAIQNNDRTNFKLFNLSEGSTEGGGVRDMTTHFQSSYELSTESTANDEEKGWEIAISKASKKYAKKQSRDAILIPLTQPNVSKAGYTPVEPSIDGPTFDRSPIAQTQLIQEEETAEMHLLAVDNESKIPQVILTEVQPPTADTRSKILEVQLSKTQLSIAYIDSMIRYAESTEAKPAVEDPMVIKAVQFPGLAAVIQEAQREPQWTKVENKRKKNKHKKLTALHSEQ